jgi:Cdc6-like AAA superfamily ATPase
LSKSVYRTIHDSLQIYACSNLKNNHFSAATIFAYGQTGSGKTFTMQGVMESAVSDIYNHIKNVRTLHSEIVEADAFHIKEIR